MLGGNLPLFVRGCKGDGRGLLSRPRPYGETVARLRAGPSLDDPNSDDSYEAVPHPQYIAVWRETPEQIAMQRETRQHVDNALATLNEKYRVVFVLRDIEEFSTRETAEILGITPEAVKVRLLRARLMLRERLTRLFGDEAQRVAPHDHQQSLAP